MTDFLHGVEVVEIQSGLRPIRTVKSAVIGLVGSAPKGPLNTPTLIKGSRTEAAAKFGSAADGIGTIPDALDAIFKQHGAAVVVVNVLDTASDKTSQAAKLFTLAGGKVTLPHKYAVNLAVKGAPSSGELVLTTDYTVVAAGQANEGRVSRVSASTKWTAATDTVAVEYTNGGVRYREVVSITAGANSYADVANQTGGIEVHNVWALATAGTDVEEVTHATADYSYDLDTGVLSRVGTTIGETATLNISYDHPDDSAVTAADIVGGVDSGTGAYSGISALLGAQSDVGHTPKILIAPGYSDTQTVANALISVADRLRAVTPIEGPSSTDDAAKTYRNNFSSRRAYVVDPDVTLDDGDGGTVTAPNAAYVAGVIAKSDAERGFWWSPSNRAIKGIVGTARPIDFALGDANARANLLNEADIATIIREKGYRLWGNRTCSADAKWAFLSVVRTADILNESLLRSHLWAVDRNITKTYFEDVAGGVNAYIRELVGLGALLGGSCIASPELNTKETLAAGRVYFDIDFTPPPPAERVTFRSRITNDYLDTILGTDEDEEDTEEEAA